MKVRIARRIDVPTIQMGEYVIEGEMNLNDKAYQIEYMPAMDWIIKM